ncbi:unnamed protein product [Acanthoscelides obtectus]|uniref:Uncharacterized protein n=1 Tax=Acanthoscelides obtectus TaxID=200917 RepID=A0A9P0M502_ACAOB|nr:unnamed protein product [Acanthoscelides obtectus]CAK1689520.1 hypothetical protein AOBTE_LOCUS37322 [Acanthoscelides obtectus]
MGAPPLRSNRMMWRGLYPLCSSSPLISVSEKLTGTPRTTAWMFRSEARGKV